MEKLLGVHFKITWLIVVTSCWLHTNAQTSSAAATSSSATEGSSVDFCNTQERCGSCIRTPNCAWCSTADAGAVVNPISNITRCVSETKINKGLNECHGQWISPKPQGIILLDHDFQKGSKQSEPVQLRPQHVKLKLRPGTPYELEVSYKQAGDYPVDLYYLMDLSNSMKDDKESLSSLGHKLAQAMQNLTSNFRLGFGSFVDKTEMPFVNTAPKMRDSPCTGCAPPYSFKNHLALSEDVGRFSTEVQSARVSGNIDSPEGGFDALMQVIVCTNQIGWRQKARHMIVFSTDADFHYAGDGKLAGIVEPNDEQCYMNKQGSYTHGLLQDYPSIAQINNKAKEKNMNIIFAVESSVHATYEILRSRIDGSSSGTLAKDSSNVVEFVTREYSQLVQEVTLIDNMGSDKYISVSYQSKCLTGEEMNTARCKGLRKDSRVDYKVKITVEECPPNRADWFKVIEIRPQAVNETLRIEVQLDCECDCENPNNKQGFKPNARECSSKGSLQCGVCVCDEGFVGRSCECSSSQFSTNSTVDDQRNCYSNDNNQEQVCSGRGDCICGQCTCHRRDNPDESIWGRHCQCDDFNSCGKWNGEVCSGKDHGKCNCGICQCNHEWTGEMCECASSTASCVSPLSGGEICSANGKCVCGKCVCDERDGQRFSGKFCEDCATCKGQCEKIKPSVEKLVYLQSSEDIEKIMAEYDFAFYFLDEITDEQIDTALYNKTGLHWFESPQAQTQEGSTFVDTSIEVSGNIISNPDEGSMPENNPYKALKLCNYPDQYGCNYKFRYLVGETGKVQVFVQKRKECGSQVNLLYVVLGVIGSILLAGLLLLLIWKVATTVHDRREYAKFENERKLAKWDRGDNPIYVDAITNFQNPTFGGSAQGPAPQ